MQIKVSADKNDFADQARAYAEYRIFSGVRRLARTIDLIDIELLKTGTTHEMFRCSVRLTMASGLTRTVETHAQHPYTAIEEAARQVTGVLEEVHV